MGRAVAFGLRARDVHPRSEGGTHRLQALADGIFAIAMTLLVLDLPTSTHGGSTGDVLRTALPHLLLYVDSMMVLGVLWFGHRNAYEYVRRTDHPHTWLSLALLALVALVPWSTGLVAAHRDAPAVSVYNVNLLLVVLLDASTWWYATGPAALVTDLPARMVRVSRLLTLVPVAGFVIAIGLGWLTPWAALGLDIALPLLAITGVTYRLQYRLTRRLS